MSALGCVFESTEWNLSYLYRLFGDSNRPRNGCSGTDYISTRHVKDIGTNVALRDRESHEIRLTTHFSMQIRTPTVGNAQSKGGRLGILRAMYLTCLPVVVCRVEEVERNRGSKVHEHLLTNRLACVVR